jgi:tetratricopeptide (TPR) repeat protein
MKTLYDVLGIRADADPEAIKQAFRRAVKAHHPDISGGDAAADQRIRRIIAANEILRDPEQRAVYDRQLALEREHARSEWRDAILRSALAIVALSLVLIGAGEIWIALTAAPADRGRWTTREAAEVATIASPQPGPALDRSSDVSVAAGPSREAGPEAMIDPSIGDAFAALSPPIPDQTFRDRVMDWAGKVDLDRDIADLDEAIRLAPNDGEAHRRRGNLWGRKGDTDRALADYAEAIRIDPNDIAIFHDRGVMWQRNGELDKALADLDRAVRMSFADPAVYSDRGAVWLEKGRYDRALADFNQALKIDPGLATASARRATALDRKGDQERARADPEQAPHLDHPPLVDRTDGAPPSVEGR